MVTSDSLQRTAAALQVIIETFEELISAAQQEGNSVVMALVGMLLNSTQYTQASLMAAADALARTEAQAPRNPLDMWKGQPR